MKTKLIKLVALVTLTVTGLLALTTPAFAAANICETIPKTIDGEPNPIWSSNGCDNQSKDKLKNMVINIINGIIAVLGLVAVIFIVVGGVQYMTSTGDSAKTKKAKDTILYAVIGMIVCVLAYAIVNFVILNIIGGQNRETIDVSSFKNRKDCEDKGFRWDEEKEECY